MFIDVTTLNAKGEPGSVLLNKYDISVIRSNGDSGCTIFLRSDPENPFKVTENMQYFRDYLN